MNAISKPDSQNIGGIRSFQFAFPSEFAAFDILPDYYADVTFVNGANWKDLYATASTLSGGGSSEITIAGVLHTYEFSLRCPQDRSELILAFNSFSKYGVVLRVTDGNSVTRIYGTPTNPMTVKGKLLLPGQVQGYNGYEIAFAVSMPDPAYLEPTEESN
jgi:hypothetical protein